MKNNIIEVLPPNSQLKQKAIKTVIIVTLFTIVSTALLYHISIWFDNNKIIFQTPVIIQKPIIIQDRGVSKAKTFLKKASAQELPTKEEFKKIYNNTLEIKYDKSVEDIENYIRKTWANHGSKEVQLALAVSSAENGARVCDTFGVNTNKTIDVGIFQINSVHNKRGKLWRLGAQVDCYNNIDRAYELWKSTGWGSWVAYSTGTYLEKMSLYK